MIELIFLLQNIFYVCAENVHAYVETRIIPMDGEGFGDIYLNP